MISAQQVPELQGVFTTYAASTPQINLKIDRERAQALGVNIADIFSALQTSMGGTYTNDFNLFGKTWQVKVQAEASDRKSVNDVFRVRIRSSSGELIPLQTVANVELITAPSSIIRYNNLRSVTLNGAPAAGYSSGDALAAMERLAKSTLPPASATNGRARHCRRRPPAARPGSSSAWRWSSPTCSWSASTRARRSRSPPCCRWRSACSAR